MAASRNRLRAYVDANVLLSGAATDNPSSASRVMLVASELTLLDLVACERVLEEIVSRSIEVVQTPSAERVSLPDTDPKDRVHLLSAVEQGCDYLVTLNPKDFPEDYEGVTIVEPGTLVKRIREQIKGLA
jgi:predicted nucleic acid-binding protein